MPYLASALLYKSLTKIGFTIAAFYVGGYLAALGAYSSTLDYSLAHSASGEGPSVSGAIYREAVPFRVRISHNNTTEVRNTTGSQTPLFSSKA